MMGTERARLVHRLAKLMAENADYLTVVEMTNNRKLFKEMRGQTSALREWYCYVTSSSRGACTRRE
jgi:acyl-CoA reductase-like NAD-dependent aldehyde dehydrogenase